MTPTPQPKALELADAMDGQTLAHVKHGVLIGFVPNATCMLAAAELRRQHAEIEALKTEVERERCLSFRGQVHVLEAEINSLHAEISDLREQLERKSDAIQRLWAERDSLRAEVERLRADAERYRWLKERPYGWSVLHEQDGWATCYGRGELDAKIDAAREAKG